jgi:hypothetical protein
MNDEELNQSAIEEKEQESATDEGQKAKPEGGAKPAEGVIPDPEKKEPEPEPVEPPAATGDAGLDVALAFFAKAGIGKDNAALKHAAETGDFALLKAELATKNLPGWEQHVALAEQAEGRIKAKAESTKAEAKATILKAVGGEEQWVAIRDWAAANATHDERKEINAALAAGGFQAKAAAEYLTARYAKAGPKDAKPAMKPGASPLPAPNGSALSPRQYAAEVEKLAQKVGNHRVTDSPEYRALQARRLAWRK